MAQRISSCGRSDCASSLEVSARHLRIFFDEFGVQFFDDEHSCDKTRFLMLGMSSGASLLIVFHCERDHGATIRIISARKASPRRVHEPLMSNLGLKRVGWHQEKGIDEYSIFRWLRLLRHSLRVLQRATSNA